MPADLTRESRRKYRNLEPAVCVLAARRYILRSYRLQAVWRGRARVKQTEQLFRLSLACIRARAFLSIYVNDEHIATRGTETERESTYEGFRRVLPMCKHAGKTRLHKCTRYSHAFSACMYSYTVVSIICVCVCGCGCVFPYVWVPVCAVSWHNPGRKIRLSSLLTLLRARHYHCNFVLMKYESI